MKQASNSHTHISGRMEYHDTFLKRKKMQEAEMRHVMDRMDEILYREEMMWLQRARVDWLKEGDMNTKFFHLRSVWRSCKNKIKRLRKVDGNWCTNGNELAQLATDFFGDLYKRDTSLDPAILLNLLDTVVTEETNESLCRQFSEEISDALFQIGPLKAPGPDGFPGRFFQHNWAVLKEDVINAVQVFFPIRSNA